jgi:AcrR family transcriptional regulator
MTDRVPRHPRADLRHPRRSDARRGRERRDRTLSREAIVAAALRIVDAEGVDAVTMRRVADELGTGPASLYAHVEDKDELLGAVLDKVFGDLDIRMVADPARWQEQVKDFGRRLRRALLAHRDLAKVSLGTVPTGPNALRGMESMLTLLVAAGLPARVIGYAGDLFAQFVTVSAYEESLFRGRLTTPRQIEEFHRELRQFFDSLPADEFPTVRALAPDLADPGEPADARFEFGLDIFVRGLAAHLGPPSRKRRT